MPAIAQADVETPPPASPTPLPGSMRSPFAAPDTAVGVPPANKPKAIPWVVIGVIAVAVLAGVALIVSVT